MAFSLYFSTALVNHPLNCAKLDLLQYHIFASRAFSLYDGTFNGVCSNEELGNALWYLRKSTVG